MDRIFSFYFYLYFVFVSRQLFLFNRMEKTTVNPDDFNGFTSQFICGTRHKEIKQNGKQVSNAMKREFSKDRAVRSVTNTIESVMGGDKKART